MPYEGFRPSCLTSGQSGQLVVKVVKVVKVVNWWSKCSKWSEWSMRNLVEYFEIGLRSTMELPRHQNLSKRLPNHMSKVQTLPELFEDITSV
eukprot:747189-Hanusia_phi.AAC.2